jgi:hypothetical protein
MLGPARKPRKDKRCISCLLRRDRHYDGDTEDYQFERFGGLCLQCRLPEHGEGHFSAKTTPDILTAILTSLLPPIVNIIAEYTAQPRRLPEWWLPDGLERFDPRDMQPRIMSILGVENAHHDFTGWDGLGVCFDSRWFKSPHCTCAEVVCACVCLRRQLINISRVLGIDHTAYNHLDEAEQYNPNEDGLHFVALMFDGNPLDCGPAITAKTDPCGTCVDCVTEK